MNSLHTQSNSLPDPIDQAIARVAAGHDMAIDEAKLDTATQVVAAIAAQHAAEVDREARFPHEAIAALREQRLLSALVPQAFGGFGVSLSRIASICSTLAHACSSTAMIFAMHQISEQLLLASATSEETIGGNLRHSACAIRCDSRSHKHFALEKFASTISYGQHADGILVTARRTPDSPPNDQVLVTLLKEDYTLEPRSSWDALGMRGTCSTGFRLQAHGSHAQILPTPFAEIADQTMLPVTHILWAACWTGIAGDAMRRAQTFCRAQARANPGVAPPGSTRLAEAVGKLQFMQARLRTALAQYREMQRDTGHDNSAMSALSFAADMNTLKTSTSATAIEVVQQALMICGMAGYKNSTPYSLGRHLRDLLSAPLMINNDRISANTANLLLAQRHTSTRL